MHVIADAHIYDRHIPIVEEIISRPSYDAPELLIDGTTDFYKFTVDSFTLKNYESSAAVLRIPVAV